MIGARVCLLVLAWNFSAASMAMECFPLDRVRLTAGPLLHSQEVNRRQLLAMDPDRLLAPFRLEAGLVTDAEPYGNWESSGLAGHTAGHYLSALATHAAATGDPVYRQRMVAIVDALAACPAAHGDGYVGGVPDGRALWRELAVGQVDATAFTLNGRWVPFYNLHKTFVGMHDAWAIGRYPPAREVLLGVVGWLENLLDTLSNEAMSEVLRCEFGGMNAALAEIAETLGDERSLRMAERFTHAALLEPLRRRIDALDGLHANTQVPKVIGFARISAMTGDAEMHDAAAFFWDTVVTHRTLAFGGNSLAEHFPSAELAAEWLTHREGPETCNSHNMLRLTERLFLASPEARYADYYERTLWNHLLAAQHPEHGGYVYFTSVRPEHYRNYSRAGEAFWCCVGTGLENPGRHGRFVYAHDGDTLYVNLFAASELDWSERGVKVIQSTRFPVEPSTRLTLRLDTPKRLAIRVRHPGWVSIAGFALRVNGQSLETKSTRSSYAVVERVWTDGDTLDISLPMRLGSERMPHVADCVAFTYGPIVLAGHAGTADLPDLLAGEGRMDHVTRGPLWPTRDGASLLVESAEQVLAALDPDAASPLRWTLPASLRPASQGPATLLPLFRLHDARYTVYWRIVDPQRYEREAAEAAEAQARRASIEARTLDAIGPGRQQPEVEHNFDGRDTETGVFEGFHFRQASGWFAYDLRPGATKLAVVRVRYAADDVDRPKLSIADRPLAFLSEVSDETGRFADVDYAVPASELAGDPGSVRVRFTALPGQTTGRVFDVRLLRDGTRRLQT